MQQSEKILRNSKKELKFLSSFLLLIDFFIQLEITILKFLSRAGADVRVMFISIRSTSQNLTASYSISAPDPYLTDSHLTVRYILL